MALLLFCLTLLPPLVSPEILMVEPDSDQFFSSSTISLKCEAQWTVKRKSGSRVESFGLDKDFGNFDKTSSTCLLNTLVPSDSGVYWCESADGTRSPERLLSVTGNYRL
uniref:Ig-like domain-containing protein n=1 Tax=Knipowitschia caucasica TaxID=637954 RepID=A0AAV2KIQ4_KNICA